MVSPRNICPASSTCLRFLLQPGNVGTEIVSIVIWEAGCLQIRLSNYKFLFLSHEIWKWMSWVPIMASLQANLKEIKRPSTPYIATRQMNWPPLSNWNPLFVQQTSVSLPNSCDIIDSSINDSAEHNWGWPTEWKYSHGTELLMSRESSPFSFVGEADGEPNVQRLHHRTGYP